MAVASAASCPRYGNSYLGTPPCRVASSDVHSTVASNGPRGRPATALEVETHPSLPSRWFQRRGVLRTIASGFSVISPNRRRVQVKRGRLERPRIPSQGPRRTRVLTNEPSGREFEKQASAASSPILLTSKSLKFCGFLRPSKYPRQTRHDSAPFSYGLVVKARVSDKPV
jgi:hypothetical protein